MFLEKPYSVTALGAVSPRPAATPDIDLYAIAAALWRRKLLLLLCGLLGMVAVLAIAKVLPHRYTATAEILVDPRDLRVLDKEVTPRSVETDSGITIVESQVAVLSSNGVLKRAIQKLDLESDPEFNGKGDNVVSRGMAWINELLGTRKEVNTDTATLQALKQNLNVIRPERTFVIQLTVSSRDEDKSVRIADAIVAAYLEDTAQYRSSSNEGAAEAIDAGLDHMKKKVNDAEQKIAAYKADHSLGLASGRLVAEQQLTETNNQLAIARTETSRIKAQLEDIKSAKGKVDTIPEVVASPTLINLKKQLATTSADRARLAAQLLPRHPARIAIDEQEHQVRSDIDQEIRRILTSVTHDYERAEQREDALNKSVQQLQADMNGSAVAQIQLRELERDLEGTRSLYEQSVARSRETREQSRMNTSNVRVISPAIAALNRAFPPRNILLAPAGFILGMLLGACLIARSQQFPRWSPSGSPDDPSKRPLPLHADEYPSLMTMREAAESARAAKSSHGPQSGSSSAQRRESGDAEIEFRVRSSTQFQNAKRVKSRKILSASTPRAVDALKSRGDGDSSEPITNRQSPVLAALTRQSERSSDLVANPLDGVNDNADVPLADAGTQAGQAPQSAVPVFDLRKISDLVNAASRFGEGLAIRRLADGMVSSPHGAFVRQIRDLRHMLDAAQNSSSSDMPRFVVFASDDGIALKPMILDAFARSFADVGKKVLVIDTDEPSLAGATAVGDNALEIVSTPNTLIDTVKFAANAAFPITTDALAKFSSYDVIVVGSDGTSQKIALGDAADIVQLCKASPDGDIAALSQGAQNLRGIILVSDRDGSPATAVHAAS